MDIFFTGLHQPSDAKHFTDRYAFVSVERLWDRVSDFAVDSWAMDSGAFSRILNKWRHRPICEYAAQIRRWKKCGNLLFAVTQDYMCEPAMLKITGLTVADHQRLSIERYDALVAEETGVYILPVLQGWHPSQYADHVRQYGDRLAQGAWVGVGSVCKRQGSPRAILDVLCAIKEVRPDLRLHGFGVKETSLREGLVRSMLYSADSMAWSFAARKQGLGANDWRNAMRFTERIEVRPEYQGHLMQAGLVVQ